MTAHIRTAIGTVAKQELMKAIEKIARTYDLTNAELNAYLSELQLSLHMAQLRHERHPDDLTKGVNES